MDALEIFTALGTPDGRANPHPHYAALHELGEVASLGPGAVVVVGYDAINSVFRDARFRASDEATFERDFPGWRDNYPTEPGGTKVGDGDSVATVIGAGKRDPRKLTDPDKFAPLRRDGAPLSFGGGAHFCIGAALARLEGTVAFPRLMSRFPKIAAAGAPVRRETFLLRGFDALPVTIA